MIESDKYAETIVFKVYLNVRAQLIYKYKTSLRFLGADPSMSMGDSNPCSRDDALEENNTGVRKRDLY